MVVPRILDWSSRPGVGTAVYLFKVIHAHMRVALGGGETGVAEHLLNGAQIRAVVEQVSRKAMAESVRRDTRDDPGTQQAARDDHFHAASSQSPTAQIGNYRAIGLPCHRNGHAPRLECIERGLP